MPNNTKLKFGLVLKQGQQEIATVEGVLTLGPDPTTDKEVLAQFFNMERTLNHGLADARVHITLDELPSDANTH